MHCRRGLARRLAADRRPRLVRPPARNLGSTHPTCSATTAGCCLCSAPTQSQPLSSRPSASAHSPCAVRVQPVQPQQQHGPRDRLQRGGDEAGQGDQEDLGGEGGACGRMGCVWEAGQASRAALGVGCSEEGMEVVEGRGSRGRDSKGRAGFVAGPGMPQARRHRLPPTNPPPRRRRAWRSRPRACVSPRRARTHSPCKPSVFADHPSPII